LQYPDVGVGLRFAATGDWIAARCAFRSPVTTRIRTSAG